MHQQITAAASEPHIQEFDKFNAPTKHSEPICAPYTSRSPSYNAWSLKVHLCPQIFKINPQITLKSASFFFKLQVIKLKKDPPLPIFLNGNKS